MLMENKTGLPRDWKINGLPLMEAAPGIHDISITAGANTETTIRLKIVAGWVMVEGKARFTVPMLNQADKPVDKITFTDGSTWVAPK